MPQFKSGIVLTPNNFDPEKLWIKSYENGAGGTTYRLYYDDERPVYISNEYFNCPMTGIVKRDKNYTTQEWTGNYRIGVFLTKDPHNPTEKEQEFLDFLREIEEHVWELYKQEDEDAEDLPRRAFLGCSKVKMLDKKTPDPNASPSMWAVTQYNLPEGKKFKECAPEEVKVVSVCRDQFGDDVGFESFVDSRVKVFFRFCLHSVVNNPQNSKKSISVKCKEIKAKKIKRQGNVEGITAAFGDDSDDEEDGPEAE